MKPMRLAFLAAALLTPLALCAGPGGGLGGLFGDAMQTKYTVLEITRKGETPTYESVDSKKSKERIEEIEREDAEAKKEAKKNKEKFYPRSVTVVKTNLKEEDADKLIEELTKKAEEKAAKEAEKKEKKK